MLLARKERAVQVAALPLLVLPVLLSACGPFAAAPAPAATTAARAAVAAPATPATPSPAPATAAAPADALTFRVVPDRSSATYRVREQLVELPLPSDAVGRTQAISGQLAIRHDGTIVSESSKITVDLRTLRSDRPLRDNFLRQNTLRTAPAAEFVPTDAPGLPRPLPLAGEASFQLTGRMAINRVERPLTFDLQAKLEGDTLTGTATTQFKMTDFNIQPPRVPVVVSVQDEVRLEIMLTAVRAAS